MFFMIYIVVHIMSYFKFIFKIIDNFTRFIDKINIYINLKKILKTEKYKDESNIKVTLSDSITTILFSFVQKI